MKKITSLLALLLAFMMLFAACGPAATTGTTGGTEPTGTTAGTTDGTTSTTQPITPPPAEKKSIKILSIGNSFSDDATQWLAYILLDMGYSVYLGNLYIGGCSIDTHWANAQSGEKAYDYRVSRWGTWSSSKQSLEFGITNQEWDIITVQQVSGNSGKPETFGNLQNLLDFINAKKKNPDAKVYWHMTWAYEGDSTHNDFPKYDSNQMTMYNAIVNAAKEKVLTNSAFTGLIPSGTAIQNLRTSYLGDRLTRDGYHLSYDVGRYTAALTWAKLLTGESIDEVDYVPTDYPNVKNHLPAIKEAVNNAVAKPMEVTPATITTHESMTMTQADKDFLTAQGKNPEDYHLIDLDVMLHSFYNSSSNSNRVTKKQDLLKYYFSTDIFDKNDLPYGTIIRIDAGYQYRPEGWTVLSAATSPRPDNTTENAVVVDSKWWGDFSYRAFNIAKEGGKTELTEDDIKAFQIYVPNVPAVEEEKPAEPETPTYVDKSFTEALTQADKDLLTSKGLDPNGYAVLKITPVVCAYYNSGDKSSLITTASNSPQFWAVEEILTKEKLPSGSVITIAEGYQYRPDAWVSLTTKNGNRPGNVSTAFVKIDSAWWGNFNYRGFNVSKTAGGNVSESDTNALRIYVPVAAE